ncbi:MAG: hypothetical protein JSV04_10910 [Candidatus Heimdallarchaeota archaeon]|nr:MAG: hypothetical protein JSV04_10910 [Candidatus Heimdallarchaeota archaeon]
MEEEQTIKAQVLSLLRLESNAMAKWTFGGTLMGILTYFVTVSIKLPEYTFTGLDLGITVIPITGGINLGLVVITIVAALCGPLAGFLVAFFGSLGANILYTQQIVALGGVNFAFGMLGFIVGIPRYRKGDGFADGKTIAKLLLFTLLAYLLMTVLYLISLLMLASQSFEGTLLYNFAPSFTVTLFSLFLFAPVFVRISEVIITEGSKFWESKAEASSM